MGVTRSSSIFSKRIGWLPRFRISIIPPLHGCVADSFPHVCKSVWACIGEKISYILVPLPSNCFCGTLWTLYGWETLVSSVQWPRDSQHDRPIFRPLRGFHLAVPYGFKSVHEKRFEKRHECLWGCQHICVLYSFLGPVWVSTPQCMFCIFNNSIAVMYFHHPLNCGENI